MEFRTRFAPSPTGYLHLGSLRTVLFGYLMAKSEGGKFFLRIEDTDQKRSVEGAIEGLLDILNWVGLTFDEGPHLGGDYGPYVQTERMDIYKKYLEELLATGKAYYCFCTSERLDAMRAEQQANKLPPRYDRHCRNLSKEDVEKRIAAGEPYVVRHKLPLDGEITVHDELRGDITVQFKEVEDYVLIKSDGIPTYQFASVVDDHTMKTSHVLRAEEWIPSLPKNIQLYNDFGWEPPKFVHMSLTLNKDGGKLSKRQGDVAVEDYRAKGYLQEALINFSALLGWHPKDDQEILTLDEIISKFNYKDMGVKGAIFDLDKLDYYNGYYIRQKPIAELVELCKPFLAENLKLTNNSYKKTDEFLTKVVKSEQERLKKLIEIGELTEFLFKDEIEYDTNLLVWKKTTLEEMKVNL
ncbi:glutamate--tRNA ligase, partial [Patescibacteria group bacterium]|nr:glutamate--tRNA ligase [Patescibacteria group bacterium]